MPKPYNPAVLVRDYENDGETVVYGSEITLRDLFALVIAGGWCSAMGRGMEAEDTDTGWRNRFGGDVYDLADAMLEARQPPGLRPEPASDEADDVDIEKNRDGE